MRASVLDVLSAIGGCRVSAICRDCRHAADRWPEVVRHSLYLPVSAWNSRYIYFFFSREIRCVEVESFVVRLQPRRGQERHSSSSTPAEEVSELNASCETVRSISFEHNYCPSPWNTALTSSGFFGGTTSNQPADGNGDNLCNIAAVDVPEAVREVEVELSEPLGTVHAGRATLSSSNVLADAVEKDFQLDGIRSRLQRQSDVDYYLSSQSGHAKLARRIGELENPFLLQECTKAISTSHSSRCLQSMLEIPPGKITKRDYDPV